MNWLYSASYIEYSIIGLFLFFSLLYLIRIHYIAAFLKTLPHTRVYLKFFLRCIILAFALIALLGPTFGYVTKKQAVSAKNWHFFVDASNSMLANDEKPSRILASQQFIENMMQNNPNDPFSINAFGPSLLNLCPLTTDREVLQLFNEQINPQLFQSPSSNAQASLKDLLAYLRKLPQQTMHSKTEDVVIIITDGEFLEGIPKNTLQQLSKLPYHYFIVGVGSKNPVTIPYKNGVLKNQLQEIVHTKLDAEQLKKMAGLLNASYYHISDELELNHKISTLSLNLKLDFESVLALNKYYYFLFMSLVLLALDIIITVRTISI
jgi:Ca-activated chloride channel family protein